MYQTFVGIDIAAATFTVAWLDDKGWHTDTFEQRRTDYGRLVHQLAQLAPPEQTLVVLEATGTYWLALAWFLHGAGLVGSVINPAQAHLFADGWTLKATLKETLPCSTIFRSRWPTCSLNTPSRSNPATTPSS